mgnify:CR=1 FL=1
MNGTNPISGEDIDTTDPGTWANYLIGGTVLVASLAAGKFVTDTVGESAGVGETVSENIPTLS